MSLHVPAFSFRGEETIPLVDCIQVAFSQSNRHHLFIVYPKEVSSLNMHIAMCSVELMLLDLPLLVCVVSLLKLA